MVEPLFEIHAAPDIRTQHTERGTLYHQDFSLVNQQQETEVYFWLEVIDPNALSLLEWYCFTSPTRIALGIGETKQATVCFEVPIGTKPGNYAYAIAAKSEQALETTIRCPLQLHLEPIQSEPLIKSVPSFTIDPPTSQATPCSLQPGIRLTLNITVDNRSPNADRFYLNCPEIPPDWFTVKYLDYGIKSGGVVQPPKGLHLNPRERGEIVLTLHPPFETASGVYRIAVQLVSMGQPDWGIVEDIYLRVLPADRLEITLTPETQVIPPSDGTFVLDLKNRGNLHHSFKIEAQHSARLNVAIEAPDNTVTLAPASETSIVLSATPRHRWQRPVWGKPALFSLEVNLTPLESNAKPMVRQAYLVWRSRRSWVRKCLLVLGLMSTLTGLVVLYRFNRQPFVAPAIAEFKPTDTVYEEGNLVRLNWKLQQSKSLDRVVLARIEDGAETERTRYDFKTSIPDRLKAKTPGSGCVLKPSAAKRSFALWQLPLPPLPWFSSLQAAAPAAPLINCQAIPVAVPKPGEYRFKLQLFSEKNGQVPIAEQVTSAITIKGTPEQPRSPENSALVQPSDQPPQIRAFSVNNQSAIDQQIQTFMVNRFGGVTVTIAWNVQNVDQVQILPSPGTATPQGSLSYSLNAGESQTITLMARNRVGQVTQSIELQAVAAREQPQYMVPRTVQPRKSIEPTPNPTPSQTPTVDPNNTNPPDPEPSAPLPTPSTSPDASPTASPAPQPK